MTRARPVGVVNRGAWTAEEDLLLKRYIEANGVGHWSTLPHKAGLMGCGKSCRLRWMNHLRPNVKRGHISPDEEDLIIRLHNLVGNRWSLIAGRVPGRTDNEVKNYWNTHLSKKLASKSFARCKTVTQIVQGQPLSCIDHQKTKAKAAINSFKDDTRKWRSKNETSEKTVFPDNFRFASSLVSPKDSKQGYSGALPGFQLADVTVKCSVDREKTDPEILEDDYYMSGAKDEFHGSTGNMEKDMADLLPISRFQESMFTTEFFSDSSWTWYDDLFSENEIP